VLSCCRTGWGVAFGSLLGPITVSSILRDTRSVQAYHGTSVERAEIILSSGQFIPSKNDYDWLGHGVYFWEHAPVRAWEWAKRKHRDRATVMEATIRLGFCLDFTDSRYTSALRISHERIREAYAKTGTKLPVNRNKANFLDCLVINYLATYIFPECETVRAPFLEGEPVYLGSALLTQSHIQVVVRNLTCIEPGFRQLPPEGAHGLEG
jgi:hypothetical protein